jgi:DNA-binding PucR family transcriptional regulator
MKSEATGATPLVACRVLWWNRCAAQLHVHVNTLRYRIRRIEQLTGRDLGTLENRVDLFLALRAT